MLKESHPFPDFRFSPTRYSTNPSLLKIRFPANFAQIKTNKAALGQIGNKKNFPPFFCCSAPAPVFVLIRFQRLCVLCVLLRLSRSVGAPPRWVNLYHYMKKSLIFARKFQAAILVNALILACRAAKTAVMVVLPLVVRT